MLPQKILEKACFAPAGDVVATRRALLLSSLLAGLPLAASGTAVEASPLDPAETIITPRDAVKFVAWTNAPPLSGEMATLYGGLDKPGPYLVLMKWHPGYMSAPHSYATDRLSLVLSGTVGKQRRRLRSEPNSPGESGRVRAACRPHAALRRREARRDRAGRDRAPRHSAGRLDPGGSQPARLAAGVIAPRT